VFGAAQMAWDGAAGAGWNSPMKPIARTSIVAGVLVFTVAAVASVHLGTEGRAKSDTAGLTLKQADEIVAAHNGWRLRVGASPLVWDPDLAARAQARAAVLAARGCVIRHGLLPDDIGENLFYVSALQHEQGRVSERFVVTPSQVVDAWGAESVDYDRVHDTCAANRQCGHYTQIVWRATEVVGCGMCVCPSLGQVWVCNYHPQGNVQFIGR
jgi:pathogenesis-related protein 1